MRNFEKIRTNKDRRAAGEIVDSHRRRKKTQKRGSAAKRMDWDQLQTNYKAKECLHYVTTANCRAKRRSWTA